MIAEYEHIPNNIIYPNMCTNIGYMNVLRCLFIYNISVSVDIYIWFMYVYLVIMGVCGYVQV